MMCAAAAGDGGEGGAVALPWSRLVWQGSAWRSFRVMMKAAWCMTALSRLLPARLWLAVLRVVPERRWVGARPA